jgi:acetolactate synthase-1/2/3 large subunit
MLEQELTKHDLPDRAALQNWWAQIDGWRAAHGLNHKMLDNPDADAVVLPQQVIQALYKATGGKAYVTSDVGQHQMFAAQYYHFDSPRRWINSGGLGTMGFGLPAAMGVQFAFPDATVACVTGEGSFMMNMQELSTCLQYGLPIKIVNVNNAALGMVKQWQDMQYGGRHSHSTYRDALPDFVRLVESFGHVGIRVDRLGELVPSMTEAFGAKYKNRLVFLDVHVDPDEHVYPMAVKGGSMRDMFLSKTETN